MTFFVITVSVMAVSILLIYKLCRFFGLELKWISLVLCAILAFVVNGATIMLSPFLTQDHYVRLAALVLVSAALVTLINEYLLKRDRRTELASAGGPAISIEEPEDTPEEEAQELLAASTSEAEELSRRLMEAMKANQPAEPVQPSEEPQAENSAESQSAAAETKVESAAAVVEDTALETAEKTSTEENTAITETTETSQAAPGEESTETAETPAAKEEASAHAEETPSHAEETPSPVEEAAAPSEAVPEEAAAQNLPKEDEADMPAAEAPATAEPQQEQPAEETPAAEPPQEQKEHLPEEAAAPTVPVQEQPEPEAVAPEPPAEEKTAEETPAPAEPSQEDSPTEEPEDMDLSLDDADEAVAALGSLDELLDYAYSHKESDPNAAISAYRAAIDRYPDDSYAPFLIIELAGLYKERASYNEAINLYAESLGLPIIAGDDAMVQEFSKTLRYLGTVQDILNKHQALATPFSKLTPEILGEIETEFARRQAK